MGNSIYKQLNICLWQNAVFLIQSYGEWRRTLEIVDGYFPIVLDETFGFHSKSQGPSWGREGKEYVCKVPDRFLTILLYNGLCAIFC